MQDTGKTLFIYWDLGGAVRSDEIASSKIKTIEGRKEQDVIYIIYSVIYSKDKHYGML